MVRPQRHLFLKAQYKEGVFGQVYDLPLREVLVEEVYGHLFPLREVLAEEAGEMYNPLIPLREVRAEEGK